MSFNQFIVRIANWLANDLLVKHLANSKAFQSFALRTHSHVSRAERVIKEGMEKAEAGDLPHIGKGGVEEAVKGMKGIRPPPRGGIAGFFEAFGKEVKSDFGGGR